ncbi:DUF1707 domain-containing protein [Patulibacter sp. SYSU D01012]|uniref:DUF1707 SHOCT-like domain-containing protein n=1 Tax=Patulibacter sp. SYSU D01012 TaxID=2817381 RepID=UPI001B3046BE|nr:DUF1707 domain-containing protein [Patulibacter sp. SYSU D01012]
MSDLPEPAASGPSGAPAIRASDAEREHAMGVLRDAAGEGRLTFEELADRLGAAGAAVTRDDLSRLTADLPVALPHEGAAPTGAIPTPAGGRELVAPTAQNAIFGDLKRSGEWRVPARSRWSTVFGDVELDLREAVVQDAQVEIDAGTVFGDVVLLVPEGVVVDVRTRTLFGDVRQKAGQSAPPGAPVVVLTGGTWFGDVRIQAKRLRERFADLLRGGPAA